MDKLNWDHQHSWRLFLVPCLYYLTLSFVLYCFQFIDTLSYRQYWISHISPMLIKITVLFLSIVLMLTNPFHYIIITRDKPHISNACSATYPRCCLGPKHLRTLWQLSRVSITVSDTISLFACWHWMCNLSIGTSTRRRRVRRGIFIRTGHVVRLPIHHSWASGGDKQTDVSTRGRYQSIASSLFFWWVRISINVRFSYSIKLNEEYLEF